MYSNSNGNSNSNSNLAIIASYIIVSLIRTYNI